MDMAETTTNCRDCSKTPNETKGHHNTNPARPNLWRCNSCHNEWLNS